MEVSRTLCLDWFRTVILLISGFTGVSHQCLAQRIFHLKNCYKAECDGAHRRIESSKSPIAT
jgi:hypothetical protein